ncbi:HAMP domain-containing sensor histidine kinase [Leptolyngbya sp. UWPOB_LEPTO1]|uniref:sensor histidine kinase n=1 Tax=Leptolyngbya sp. UWPOB_LEPTO1 TaxID=2815653 RepID=UPI00257B3B73|nr:HAMP domain-containing sensor histidine kinase [Leptolyngbya sp. UWPOB_LEPTO1]
MSFVFLSRRDVQNFLSMSSFDAATTAKFLTLAAQLTTLSLIFIGVLMLIMLGLVWRLLSALRHFHQWTTSSTHRLDPYPLNLYPAPTEIKGLAQRWNEIVTQLATVKDQQRQFTNAVAHELRSPLSLIYGYLQRSQKQNQTLTDTQKETLAMAITEAERMTLILKDLIDLARIESINIAIDEEVVILNDFVHDVVNMTEQFESCNIETKLSTTPIRVQTNRDYLMQILDHLISNAIKHSNLDIPIIITLHQESNTAIIQVHDRGSGISPSQQAFVFEPFYRTDPSRARTTGGTGLGLTIAKTLAERMGGNITVESQPGEGSTFTLTLPAVGTRS